MTFFIFLVSIFLGAVAGTVYGCSFFKQINAGQITSKSPFKNLGRKKFFGAFLLASLRILLIGTLWCYILSSQQVSIILVLASFLVSFWIMIIKKKAA